MANGPRPRRPLKVDTTLINPALRREILTHNAGGLLDTLIAIAGRQIPIDTIPDFAKEPGLFGGYNPPGERLNPKNPSFLRSAPGTPEGVIMARDLPRRLFVETLIHEYGHGLGEQGPLPSVRAASKKGKFEASARPVTRAMLALRELSRDTANTQGVIEQFERGIHPNLSIFEISRGNVPGTQRVLAELLGLSVYARHPLQPQRERLLRESGSIR